MDKAFANLNHKIRKYGAISKRPGVIIPIDIVVKIR
jgi:hypothetical protein